MPFKKGSKEAKEHMAKIRLRKGDPRLKNINKTPKVKSRLKQEKEYAMDIPAFGDPELVLPEFMAVQNEDGTVKLVNPLTNARHLATRGHEVSVRLSRKPVKKTVLESEGRPMKTVLTDFKKGQRGEVKEFYEKIVANENKPLNKIPSIGGFKNAERGRPETLPKNIKVNFERAKKAKARNLSPKHHSSLRKKAKAKALRKSKRNESEDEEETKEEKSDLEEEKEEEPEEKPKKTRKKRVPVPTEPYERKKRLPKSATPEEKAEAKRIAKRDWARRKRASQGEGIGGKISAKDLKALHESSYKGEKDKQVGDWELDPSISKATASVYVNKKTKQPIVVHRGTEGTLSDWANNLAYVTGNKKKTQRYKDSEAVQKEAEAKYGDTLTTGHSQGGIYTKLAKNKKGIIDVNPASMGEVASEGTTIRSKTDPVSLLAGLRNMFTSNKKNITTSGKANPLKAHSIDILDELGDTELGNGIKGKGKKFSSKQLTDIILHKNKVIEDLEKNAYGKGFVKDSKKVLKHLVSHIADMKESVDPRDFDQAKMLINDFKKVKEGKKISGNGIMPTSMMGCGGVHHHYHMSGEGIESLFRDMGKYVQPVADAGMDRAMKEIKGNGIESMFRDLGKYVQPVADAGMDRAMKEIKGSGFKKGSKEAMEHMARIRGMKKGKKAEPESESESDEEEEKPKPKRRGRMVKGSPEAKAWAEKMRSLRRK